MSVSPSLMDANQVPVCPNPIFVLGSPRSGTSALAQSLGQHSHLWYSTETSFVCNLFDPKRIKLDEAYSRGQYWLRKHEVTRQEFGAAVGLGINALFTSRSGGKRWIEKTPGDALVADVLADVFPGGFFVHILRDGRHAVRSMVYFMDAIAEETKLKWKDAGYVPEWCKDFRSACKIWREHVMGSMALAERYPERCLTVRYEELVADPEYGFGRILRFIEEPVEQAPSEFFRSHRIQSSFPGRWREGLPDPWSEWSLEERQIFLEEAGATMLRYGLVTEEQLRQLHAAAS